MKKGFANWGLNARSTNNCISKHNKQGSTKLWTILTACIVADRANMLKNLFSNRYLKPVVCKHLFLQVFNTKNKFDRKQYCENKFSKHYFQIPVALNLAIHWSPDNVHHLSFCSQTCSKSMQHWKSKFSNPRLRCHPEVTSDQTNAHGVFPDQNYIVWDLVPAHNSMIRGHFGLGMVGSEVTSVWGWYDQRSLWSGDGMIRGHFGLGMVWSELTLVWGW